MDGIRKARAAGGGEDPRLSSRGEKGRYSSKSNLLPKDFRYKAVDA